MGLRVRLRADYDSLGSLSESAHVVARAMQRYGMILADNGSNFYFQGEDNPGWTEDDVEPLKTIPASAFEAHDAAAAAAVHARGSAAPRGQAESARSIASTMLSCVGAVVGLKRASSSPSLADHELGEVPLDVAGAVGRVSCSVSHAYSGWRAVPLTSSFANIGKVTSSASRRTA